MGALPPKPLPKGMIPFGNLIDKKITDCKSSRLFFINGILKGRSPLSGV